jgi:hypothetical protein
MEGVLGPPSLTRKEPEVVAAPQQHRPVLVHVGADQSGHMLIKWELELDPVLHIVVREHEPVGLIRPCWSDEVLLQPDPHQVLQPHGGDGKKRDCNGELRPQGCFDRGVVLAAPSPQP